MDRQPMEYGGRNCLRCQVKSKQVSSLQLSPNPNPGDTRRIPARDTLGLQHASQELPN